MQAKNQFSVLAAILVALLAGLAIPSPARSQVHTFQGEVLLSVKGYGSVKPGRGFEAHYPPFQCGGPRPQCGGDQLYGHAERVVLTVHDAAGWKFANWHGPCRGDKTKPTCVIQLSRIHIDANGFHVARLRADFVRP